MKYFAIALAAGVMFTATQGAFAISKTGKIKAAAPKAAKTLTCPSCKMPMATTKSAAAPVPVKVGKTTYYCCASCASGMKAAAAAKKHKM